MASLVPIIKRFILFFTQRVEFDPLKQGCIRPRPSPFWRPTTRYNGISDPLRGGFRLQGFRIFGHEAAETAPKSPFWKILKIF